MRRAIALALSALALPVLALAACGKSPEEKARDPEAIKSEMTEAAKFMAGQWDTTVEIVAADMPGMPPGMMNSIVGQKNNISDCVTAEEAEKDAEAMFKKQGEGSCTYQRFSMSGGRIDALMTCTGGKEGGTSEISMAGTYSADSYQMATEMKVSNPQMPGGAMTMKAKTTGRRTGACA